MYFLSPCTRPAMLDEIRDLLPAYCAGSLPEEMHARVEEAILRSPELLAEATELSIVNDHLIEVRRALDAETAS